MLDELKARLGMLKAPRAGDQPQARFLGAFDSICSTPEIGADDQGVAEPEEQAGLEHADHGLKPDVELDGVRNLGEVAINDRIAAVGQIGLSTVACVGSGFCPPSSGSDARYA